MKNNNSKRSFNDILASEVNEETAIIQEIAMPTNNKNLTFLVKREDLLHPTISGNKWRKLKYNLIEAHNQGYRTLLTFGGAYSNHIYSTASAGRIFGFDTIGIIRGEEHLPLNSTLSFAVKCGMKLHYIDRTTYRKKTEYFFLEKLENEHGKYYLIPEGGTNTLAIKGCSEITIDINTDFDFILSACGTGGTLSGIISGLNGKSNIIGIPVLKGANFLYDDITNFVKQYSECSFTNWKLDLKYHMGGYAKIKKELILFIKEFEQLNKIALDPIYTGKLFYAIQMMSINNEFPDGSTILAIHTGGLQGKIGMQNKIDKLLS